MGSLCSPDRQKGTIDIDIKSRKVVNEIEDSESTTYSRTDEQPTNTNPENNIKPLKDNNDVLNFPQDMQKSYSDNLEDIDEDIEPATNIEDNEQEEPQSEHSATTPSPEPEPEPISIQYDTPSAREKEKRSMTIVKPSVAAGGFKIVLTPPSNSIITKTQNGYKVEDPSKDGDANSKPAPKIPSRKDKFDSTLGGKISWKKVADFSALLPQDVKLKLWNGVFKNDTDYKQPEIKRISKVIRTFAMLQLTREYKRQKQSVPNDIKSKLALAVKGPSKWISLFIKKDETFIDDQFLTIYTKLCEKFQTDDPSKIAKYAKKTKIAQDNYVELTKEDIKQEFNKEDFLKNAFLQYILYSFQLKLDGI